MQTEHDWDLIRNERGWRLAGSGIRPLPLAVLFGAGAIALTLLVVPMLDGGPNGGEPEIAAYPANIDAMATGAIGRGGSRYVIRRSVLQSSPDAVCVIRESGTRVGDC